MKLDLAILCHYRAMSLFSLLPGTINYGAVSLAFSAHLLDSIDNTIFNAQIQSLNMDFDEHVRFLCE